MTEPFRGISDPSIAASIRDIMEATAAKVVDSKIRVRKAIVDSISPDKRKVTVHFTDEPDNPFTIDIGTIIPNGPGQVVEVTVRNGMDYSITQVYGASNIYLPIPDAATGPTDFRATSTVPGEVQLRWDPSQGADGYEIWASLDASFTGVRSIPVSGSTYTDTGLTPGDIWWYKVRAFNSIGPSPFSSPQSVRVASQISDRLPPEDSPPTTVRGGIGMLTATWPVQPNDDVVTYEVHIDTNTGFAPSVSTMLGETSGTFWVTTSLADGNALQKNVRYYMRVVAKDVDGSAGPGAQGSALLGTVDLGVVGGTIPSDSITGDGVVPTMPGTPVVSSGIGYLYATWSPSDSVDTVQYEVHISTQSEFVPDANTRTMVTQGQFAFIRREGPGLGSGPLVYGRNYYIRTRPVDRDGFGPFSQQALGFTVKTATIDIERGAITAESLIVADAAIGTAQMEDLSVVQAKIAFGAVGELQVGTAAIGTAQIKNLAVSDAKIQTVAASKITTDTLSATLTISGTIRTSVTTNRVEMNSAGLFFYGSDGLSRLSLLASNSSAYIRGSVNAESGNFSGNIYSSARIEGGTLVGTTIEGANINGGLFKSSRSTAGSGNYILIGNTGINDPVDEIRFFYADANVSSIRNPTAFPGSLLFSLSNGQTMMMHGTEGLVTNGQRLDTRGGSVHAGAVISNGVQLGGSSTIDFSNRYIAGCFLNTGSLFLRTQGDHTHSIRHGRVGFDGPDISGYEHVGFMCLQYSSTTWAARVDGSGNMRVRGSGLFSQSTERGKRNIATMDKKGAGDILDRVRPVKFKRRGGRLDENEYGGVIAEEIMHTFPELVALDEDGNPEAVNYQGFIPYLIASVQRLNEQVFRPPAPPTPVPPAK